VTVLENGEFLVKCIKTKPKIENLKDDSLEISEEEVEEKVKLDR
jgi:hypothetical protein